MAGEAFNMLTSLTTLPRSTSAMISVTVAFAMWTASAAAAALDTSISDTNSSTSSLHTEWSVPAVAAVVVSALLLLTIVITVSCTDCYNSEVSSDFHPATGHSEVRWGGASGYHPAATSDTSDPVLGSGFTGEVVIPGRDGQGLPYTMIPTQVPEAQGFRGYGDSQGPSAPQGFGGYAAPAGWGGRQEHLPGAHVSPLSAPGAEEPPPSYHSSVGH